VNITLTREEAQQVLDALEQVTKQMLSVRDELAERGARPITNTHYQKLWDSAFAAYTEYALPAAETLRARLAQPELMQRTGDCLLTGVCVAEGHCIQKAQPEPQPVAFMYEFLADKGNKGLSFEPQQYADNIPLYAAPPPCQTCVSLARAVMMNQFGRC